MHRLGENGVWQDASLQSGEWVYRFQCYIAVVQDFGEAELEVLHSVLVGPLLTPWTLFHWAQVAEHWCIKPWEEWKGSIHSFVPGVRESRARGQRFKLRREWFYINLCDTFTFTRWLTNETNCLSEFPKDPQTTEFWNKLFLTKSILIYFIIHPFHWYAAIKTRISQQNSNICIYDLSPRRKLGNETSQRNIHKSLIYKKTLTQMDLDSKTVCCQ